MSIYNGENASYLEECLASLERQTERADEVVLVEDGTIGSELNSVIERFRSKLNIISPKLETNSGLGKALNYGLRYCQGDVVFRMDTDDVCFPDRFETQLKILKEEIDVSLVGSQAIEMSSNGTLGGLRNVPVSENKILELLWANPFIHPSVAIRKNDLIEIGAYNEKLSRRQDYELWFRCAHRKLRMKNISRPLIYYRFDESAFRKQTSKLAFKQGLIGFKWSLKVGLPMWKAVACFAPFLRSILPAKIEYIAYICMKKFDPRNVTKSGG
jgi:glycosyltransferase involved in cell wall biosynthesis|tara:strand:+ start:12252 stop:13064 length:813 start_codon:yes stop_codon:yes gene_type:complete